MPAINQGLPLPSTGGAPNTTVKPNPVGAAAQSGVGAENLASLNDFSKRLDELGKKLRYRMENITSVTQTAQQGAFNAFGNNFVTRAGIQSVGAVKDAFQTFTDRRTEEEKAKDDPVLAAALTLKEIKGHTKLLENIQEATRLTSDLILDLIEKDKSEDIVKGLNELAVLFEPPKEKPVEEKEKVTKIKVDDIIDAVKETEELDRKVKDTVNVKAKVVPEKDVKPTQEQRRAKNREEVIDVDTVEVKPAPQENVVDIEEIKPTNDVLRLGNETAKDRLDTTEEKEDNKADTVEKKNSEKMLLLMTSMSKNMEKLVAGPMSTQEADLEANAKKIAPLALPDGTKKNEEPKEKSSSWWEKLLGLAGLRGMFGLLTKGVSSLLGAFTGAAGIIWSLVKKLGGGALGAIGGAALNMIGGAGKLIGKGAGKAAELAVDLFGKTKDVAKTTIEGAGDLIKTGAGKAGDVAKTAGKGLGGMLKGGAGKLLKLGKALGPQALLAAGMAGADGIAGMFGVGKDENGEDIKIDTEQDDKNWNKMTAFQKLESSIGRGIEHGADFMFMGNLANAARKKRIDAESEFFAKQEKESLDKALRSGTIGSPDRLSPAEIRDASRWTESDRVGMIEENERELVRLQKRSEAAKERSTKESMMQVVNSNVTNNSLIMPSRRYARNLDSSFNSYLKTSF